MAERCHFSEHDRKRQELRKPRSGRSETTARWAETSVQRSETPDISTATDVTSPGTTARCLEADATHVEMNAALPGMMVRRSERIVTSTEIDARFSETAVGSGEIHDRSTEIDGTRKGTRGTGSLIGGNSKLIDTWLGQIDPLTPLGRLKRGASWHVGHGEAK